MKKEKNTPGDDNILQEPEAAYIRSAPAHNYRSTRVAYLNPMRRALALMGLANDEAAKQLNNNTDYINYIREGLPKKAIDNLSDVIGFSPVEMADILHTTDRTLRRYTAQQRLNAEQSERIIEVAKLYARGEEVFDSIDVFKTWMNTPVMALGNVKPKSFLDTSMGISLLMDELGRIEHGIFA